jgi:probable HAF family extracellular repeat protein
MNMKKLMCNARTMIAMAATLISTNAAANAAYKFVQLNVPGASYTSANGISNDNVVVGTYSDAAGSHAFTYDIKTKAYTYPIGDPKGPNGTAANSINTSGNIVGAYTSVQGQDSGMLDQGGSFYDFNMTGCLNTVMTGNNDGNETVGYCEYQSPVDQTYHFEAWVNVFGAFTFQCPGAIDTSAFAFNNNGEVVGLFDTNSMGPIHGFLAGYGTCSQTIDYPGAFLTVLTGINDAGTILGHWSTFDGPSSAFLYYNGTFTDIVAPPAAKKGITTGQINNKGWFVGTFYDHLGTGHTFYARPN